MLGELDILTETLNELVDITGQVRELVRDSGVIEGICHVFVPHATAGVTLNENWDPSVRDDIVTTLDGLVPYVGSYRHAEGNSAAHIKALLVGSSCSVPVVDGRLLMGRWQGIYLAEFDGPRCRRVLARFMPA